MYYPRCGSSFITADNIYSSDSSSHFDLFKILSVEDILLISTWQAERSMATQEASPSKFKILYFAAASSFTKKQEETLPAPIRICDLFSELDKRYPGIKGKVLDSCAVTVNLEYIDLDESAVVIKDGDEVGIIPPVSSG
jgi:molybdopterin converting factor small subunit